MSKMDRVIELSIKANRLQSELQAVKTELEELCGINDVTNKFKACLRNGKPRKWRWSGKAKKSLRMRRYWESLSPEERKNRVLKLGRKRADGTKSVA